MKIIAIPILILLVMTQTFSKWVMIFQYELNKSYIAAVLCENKDKPLLHCEGKCKLMEKMRADEQQNSPVNNKPVKVSLAEAIFLSETFSLSLSRPSAERRVFNSYYTIRNYPTPHFAVFHPPAVS